MKKGLVLFMALGLVMLFAGTAFAADITPMVYNLQSTSELGVGAADYTYYEQGDNVRYAPDPTIVYLPGDGTAGNADTRTSTHPQGTWNSPYTAGVDGYNYNDPQDYATEAYDGHQVKNDTTMTMFNVAPGFEPVIGSMFQAFGANPTGAPMSQVGTYLKTAYEGGPHGGYLTSTHKCRECHAVHRAAGKFKLTRSNTRYEACDWCHGTGAGSGYNIMMDNNDTYTREYNVGHSMGFGVQDGKWKAPDDTYPAFTPPYWQGGFSCFDCHSPHANPQRLMGFGADGKPIPSIVDLWTGDVYNVGNPGHDMYTSTDVVKPGEDFAQPGMWVVGLGGPLPKSKPYYLAGSWLLIKDPDKEINSSGAAIAGTSPLTSWNYANPASPLPDGAINVADGAEIPDALTEPINLFTGDDAQLYPVNKFPIDWNNPVGSASLWDYTTTYGFYSVFNTIPEMFVLGTNDMGTTLRNPLCRSILVDEFCSDCHDGNAGLSTIQAPMFSEDRALRQQITTSGTDGDLAGNVSKTAVNSSSAPAALDYKGQYDIAYSHDVNSRH